MSAALLDTHVLVWLLNGDEKLGATARQTINVAAREGKAQVSAITPWEIGMLVAKGRVAFDRDVGEWVDVALAKLGIRLVPVSPAIAIASTRLPGAIQRDPADRIIAATAISLDATLLTADARLLAYSTDGNLRAADASI